MSQKRIYLSLAHMSGNRGCASVLPDNKTTSQQDNEWGFARLRRQRTTDNRQRTTELGLRKASPLEGI